MKNPLIRTATIESLSRDETMALRAKIAKERERDDAAGEAVTLTEAGADDAVIDAAEARHKLAGRAAIRLDHEISEIRARRKALAEEEQARIEKMLTRSVTDALNAHAKTARAASESAFVVHRIRQEMATANMHRQLASVPLIPGMVYDQSSMGGTNPRISADHPLLDLFENEIERFARSRP